MLIGSLSQTEKAFRDTLITKATGEWLTRLSRIYGIPRPLSVPEDDWRAALKAAALGPRGVPGVTFDFLRGVLQTYQLEVACTVDPAQPQRLTAAVGTPFTQDHIGTFVRIQLEDAEDPEVWPVYWISGPADIATSGGAWVELVRQSTGQWTGADWGGLGGVTNATAQLQPFTLREPTPGPDDPAPDSVGAIQTWLLVVNLLAAVTLGVPPTYMISPAGDARPVGEPYGGHIQADEYEPGSQTTGPYPPYLTGTSFGGISTALDRILASGCHTQFKQL